MAKSVRQQRVHAVDDLRDMADALEQAADLFEETLGDLDSVAENGGVRKTGKNLPYDQLKERVSTYSLLLPAAVRIQADAHLGVHGEHDPETCLVCAAKSNPEKGWLMTAYNKLFRKELKRAVAEGDAEIVREIDEEVQGELRRALRQGAYEALEETLRAAGMTGEPLMADFRRRLRDHV